MLDIVNLIERNSITRLTSTYQNRIIEKIKSSFLDTEQQIFLGNFYCYINYDSVNDFVIDFDNIWKWIGFTRKDSAKKLLEKHFVKDVDYKIVFRQLAPRFNSCFMSNSWILKITSIASIFRYQELGLNADC